MVSDWEYYYNGLTFGGAQPFGVTKVTGLNPPNARADVMEKAVDDGAFVYAQFTEQRIVTVEGDLATAEMETDLDSLRRAFNPQDGDLPLTFKRPGAGERRIYCVPTRVHFDLDSAFDIGYLTWAVELIAGDPRIYDETESTTSTGLNPVISGVSFPIEFNLEFGGGGITTVVAYNSGTFDAPHVIRVTGPAQTIRLRNLTTSREMHIDTLVAAGDYIDVDFGAKTVMYNDVSSRYGGIQEGSEWWYLVPGNNTIAITAAATTAASSATVTWRSAWI